MKKVWLYILILIMCVPVIIRAEEKTEENLLDDGKSAILIEASTGDILYEKNSHDRYAPASMTKIMSMILIMEYIENNKLKWDDYLITSDHAASMGGSQIFLQPNEKMTVKDLFKAVSIGSANDATVVFAEAIAGTEERFVNMMNEKAKQLGLNDTNFKNATGLDAANHYSSAYDMAIMSKELVKHEKIFEFTTIYEDYLRQNTDNKFWLVNTNKLIKTYSGVDGLKTGYTTEAGYCLTATIKKDNMRLIGVIMGASDGKARNNNMIKLINYGFNLYKVNTVIKKGERVAKKIVPKADSENINIVANENANILLGKQDEPKNYNYEMRLNNFSLPITKGSIIGKLTLKDGNKSVLSINLTTDKDIKKANILKLYKRTIKGIITGGI